MATCAVCGTRYQPEVGAEDCPSCSKAPQRPGAKPMARTGASAARAVPKSASATPKRTPTESGGSHAPKSAAGAAAGSSASGSSASGSSKGAPAASGARRTAPAPAASKGHAQPHASHRRSHIEKAPVLDATTRMGMFAALGLAVVVGIVVIVVQRSKNAELARIAAYEKQVQDIFAELDALDTKDPVAAQRLLDIAAEKESTWRDHQLAAEIQRLVLGAKKGLASSEEERVYTTRFADLEKQLEKGDLTSERLKDIRRDLEESEEHLADGGAELVARQALARKKADELYAQRLLDEARATRDGDPNNVRPALSRYQTAEDEIKQLLDRAFNRKDDERKEFYLGLYKQAVAETDGLADVLFVAEGEKLSWTNCLVPPQAGYWNPSAEKGFKSQVKDGVLTISGPAADAKSQPLVSIGDREQWRHFQVELEFVVEQGNLDLCLRLGKDVTQNTLSYALYTTGSEAKLKPGREYQARISVIGSRLDVRFEGDDIDTPAPIQREIPWTMTRKGAIAFLVAPETSARFTRFEVRELR